METACGEHRLTLENAPIGPVPGSLGLEDGKDVEKKPHAFGSGSGYYNRESVESGSVPGSTHIGYPGLINSRELAQAMCLVWKSDQSSKDLGSW